MKWLGLDQDVEDGQVLCDGEWWEAHGGSLMLKFHRYNELVGAPQFILIWNIPCYKLGGMAADS